MSTLPVLPFAGEEQTLCQHKVTGLNFPLSYPLHFHPTWVQNSILPQARVVQEVSGDQELHLLPRAAARVPVPANTAEIPLRAGDPKGSPGDQPSASLPHSPSALLGPDLAAISVQSFLLSRMLKADDFLLALAFFCREKGSLL